METNELLLCTAVVPTGIILAKINALRTKNNGEYNIS
jgi:hypothetical protein